MPVLRYYTMMLHKPESHTGHDIIQMSIILSLLPNIRITSFANMFISLSKVPWNINAYFGHDHWPSTQAFSSILKIQIGNLSLMLRLRKHLHNFHHGVSRSQLSHLRGVPSEDHQSIRFSSSSSMTYISYIYSMTYMSNVTTERCSIWRPPVHQVLI